MFSYVAYGLGIQSALHLPELVPGMTAADVVVRMGRVDRVPSVEDGTGAGFWATTEEACHFQEDVGAFLVRGGREIIIDAAPGVEERVLRMSLLGPALGLLLHQKGRVVLHASAVEVADSAVAFMGARGWGKSALAAALYARGYRIVADDVTAIEVSAGCPTVFPGFPQLKLWPEVVASLGEDPEALPRLHPLFEKRARYVSSGFSHRALPLRCIYVLAEGPAMEIEPIPPQERVIQLLRHWYGARFGDGLLQAEGAAPSHFLQCARFASTVTIRRLKRPRSLPPLLDLARMVENDLAHNV
jgi:hypothetical protein